MQGDIGDRLIRLGAFISVLLLCACNSKSDGIHPQPPSNAGQLERQLHETLIGEFNRLGIDPEKVTAAAPSGSDNAVFDMAAKVLDPDGPPDGEGGGELPPTGIELAWTERLIGDYDQNGEVNYSDITPLGLHFNSGVDYDDASLHGGFGEWPAGDPGDGATGTVNWRMARVDGEANGELNFADVTPLAVHWQERLSGYRVYRKAPGESKFSVLSQAGGPEGYTLAHPAMAPANEPVRYLVSDEKAIPGGLGDGDYAYYVVPYDAQSDSEGPASAVLTVNLTTQVVNQSPVARLAVDPGFAGAPAEITLDASSSYDNDGSISAYKWDFDADGTPDWLSTDPVPEQSSGGVVDSIEEVSPGVVKVRYFQGNEEWYYPSVIAVDDDALESVSARDVLGISGWVSTELNPGDGDYLVRFKPDLISIDPNSGDIVLLSSETDENFPETSGYGIFFARETASAPWDVELIEVPDVGPWQGWPSYKVYLTDIAWDENGRPVVFFMRRKELGPGSQDDTAWTAQQLSNGNWRVEQRVFSTDSNGSYSNSNFMDVEAMNDGTLVALAFERLRDSEDLLGNPTHLKYHLFTHYGGVWNWYKTITDTANTMWQPTRILTGLGGEIHITLTNPPESPQDQTWWSQWTENGGLQERERLGDGAHDGYSGIVDDIVRGQDGSVYCINRNGGTSQWWLLGFNTMWISVLELQESNEHFNNNTFRPCQLLENNGRISYFVQHGALSSFPDEYHYVEFVHRDDNSIDSERIMANPQFDTEDVALVDAVNEETTVQVCLLRHGKLEPEEYGFNYRICHRVDPSIN